MSPIRAIDTNAHKPTTAPPLSGIPKNPTRKEKAQAIVGEILPQALALGLQAHEALDAKPSKTRGNRPTKKGEWIGAAGAGAASITTSLGKALPLASRWTGIAGGILGVADIALSWGRSSPTQGAASGTTIGAAIGTLINPGAGTAIGAAIGALAGGLLGSIKTGKHHDQNVRDAVRSFLVEKGVLGTDYSIGLADGSRFDIGLDGGPKKVLNGRRPFEVAMDNPLAKYAISWMNPVIALISKGNKKVQSDFVGYFANAALSNARTIEDLRANVNAIVTQFGLDDKTLAKATIQAVKAGTLDEQTAAAYLNGIEERGGAVRLPEQIEDSVRASSSEATE